MLRFFHRYQKHVLGVALVCAVALAMSGFGINLFTPRSNVYAIRIDKQEIDAQQFEAKKRSIENRYRAIFGKNFDSMRASLRLNLGEQARDALIQEALIDRILKSYGFAAGAKEYDEYLQTNVFQNSYTPQHFQAILEQNNLTEQSFRDLVEHEVARTQFTELITDASRPSESEIKALYERRETKYNISYLAFEPAKFVGSAAEPTADQIEKYYTDHESDFALPERVSYSYVAFDPQTYRAKVTVHPEDLELAYSDSMSKYMRPEQVKVRHIQLNFPSESDPKKMADVRTKAKEVFEKAKAGEPFESLVLQYSDDITTKALGGDLGWLSRGIKAPQFDTVAFALKSGGVGNLVETDYGFHILKVEQYRAPEPKPFDEVKAEIEAQFRLDEAPAYAADSAREMYEKWNSGSDDLGAIAQKSNLPLQKTAALLSKDEDPSPVLKGLTSKVLEQGGVNAKLLIELPEQLVLVSPFERKEIELRPLESAKPEIVTKLKEQGSREAAKKKADETLAKLKDESYSDLTAAAKGANVTLGQEKDLMPDKNSSGILASEEIRSLLKRHASPLPIPNEVIENDGKFQIVGIDAVVKPDLAKAADELESLRRTQTNNNMQLLLTAMIEREKARADIQVQEGLIGGE